MAPAWQAEGQAERLSSGSGHEYQPRASAGDELVFSSRSSVVNLWSLPLNREGGETAPQRVCELWPALGPVFRRHEVIVLRRDPAPGGHQHGSAWRRRSFRLVETPTVQLVPAPPPPRRRSRLVRLSGGHSGAGWKNSRHFHLGQPHCNSPRRFSESNSISTIQY